MYAVQADSNYIHESCLGARQPRPAKGRESGETVFGRRYLGVAINEAHTFRNLSKAYTAVQALRGKTDLFVGMTATPVHTRPSVRKRVWCDVQIAEGCVECAHRICGTLAK